MATENNCAFRASEIAYHANQAAHEEAVNWLASQEELKAHQHVLSRLDAMQGWAACSANVYANCDCARSMPVKLRSLYS